jgi:hypothetical protein
MNKEDWLTRNQMLKPYFKAYHLHCKVHMPHAYECMKDSSKWFGGVRYYKLMPVEVLKKLIELDFADPEERQNCSPSIMSIVEFMERWPNFVFAHGYAVSDQRDDYRISVEGVEGIIPKGMDSDADFRTDFIQFWTGADELELNNNGHFRVWYD